MCGFLCVHVPWRRRRSSICFHFSVGLAVYEKPFALVGFPLVELFILSQIKEAPGKGLGAFALTAFCEGDYVCEYRGELMSGADGKRRQHRLEVCTKIMSVNEQIHFFRKGLR